MIVDGGGGTLYFSDFDHGKWRLILMTQAELTCGFAHRSKVPGALAGAVRSLWGSDTAAHMPAEVAVQLHQSALVTLVPQATSLHGTLRLLACPLSV